MAQNSLPQALRGFQLGIELTLEVVDDGELTFNRFRDGFLFSQRRKRERSALNVLLIDARLIYCPLRTSCEATSTRL
jgi:hypothetical protein